ncbi:uncharacterized protein LOC144909010 isoform X3 [Branchiostoma floridae x Branchiostoma belcheri]
MVNMWKFLVFIAAVVVRPDSAQGEEYLATVDSWNFYKVRVTGRSSMSNANVRAACEAVGLRYPCHFSGSAGCSFGYWTSGCIRYDGGDSCRTHSVLAANLCGTTDYWDCRPLDDTFVYIHGWSGNGACGVDYGTNTYCLEGENYSDMYALCADPGPCSSAPCLNGATCQDDGENNFTCQCVPGYNGTLCEIDIDECSSDPCQNNATCQDGVNSFTCQCAPGYTGTLCEEIDDCSSAPCQNNATCQDGVNSFTCQCAHGYTGTLCEEIDECSSAPCQNGAVCYDEFNSFTCQCAPGFTGTVCETELPTTPSPETTPLLTTPLVSTTLSDIDDCLSSPCAHGTCTDGRMSYTCSCENGWTGNNCDQDIDECATNPCLSGGTCVDHVNGYSCVCPEGFVGDKCETVPYPGGCLLFSDDAVSYPEASQVCQTRGGHLVDVKEAELQRLIADSILTGSDVSPWIGLKLSPGVMTYTDGSSVSDQLQWFASEPAISCDLCTYLDGTSGYLAKTASCAERHQYVCQSEPKPCEQDICFNNGVCSTCFNDSYSVCDCPDGYEGDLCNINIDECSSNPCQNGGTCLHGVNSYSCHCDVGYGGENCQNDLDLCAQFACPFNWQCQDQGNHFICLAGTRLAEPYSCSSASCPGGMYCREEESASFSCRAG